jgi:DNA-binding HxlR family transcriptional regulator
MSPDDSHECLPEPHETLTREVLTRASGRWSYWVLRTLGDAGGPVRFSRLQDAVGGITQKVLTQTLRCLERDGLISRTIFPQVPPRVEYAVTELGRDFLAQIEPVVAWTRRNIRAFEASRARFDGRASPP